MRDSPHPITIKTSAPSLDGVVERARLIDALAKLPAAAKWLQAPSGTGKSTLAASYARSSKKPLAWYRLDERDNDPVFFYAEFAQALSAQLRIAGLPRFSADDHERQQEFAQGFAAALSEKLAKPALIVLDDVQRVISEAMQQALAAVIPIATNGSELVFVSESIAPNAFFDGIAARRLALLNDADLHFDSDECKAMTAGLRVDAAQSESIAALTGGHAGALVLACELLRGTDARSALGVATVERIHSHLLSKLIDRMPPARSELLLKTAFVMQLTRPIAAELAGLDAASELDALVDSGLLRRVGVDEKQVFESHGLIRQGMQALARARLGKDGVRALAEQSAAVLIDHRQSEAAFTLLSEVRATNSAIGVMQQLSERYAVAGHTDLLLSSIAKLPAADVERNAWLCFWTGQALLRIDEEQARVWLSRSYSAFESAGDSPGMRLAAASIVTAYGLECGDLRELDLWIERHKLAGGEEPIENGVRFETSLMMGVMCSAFVRGSYPPRIDAEALVARMQSLLESERAWISDDQRVQGARLLIERCRVFANLDQGKNLIVATRFEVENALASKLHRGRWLIAAAYTYFEAGDFVKSAEYLNQARSLTEQSKSERLRFELGQALADQWMKTQDLQRAADELHALEELAGRATPAQRAEFARMMARLLLLQERLPEGLRWAEEAHRLALPAGYSGANLRAFEMELVYALTANDRLAEAVDIVGGRTSEPRETRLAVENCLRFLMGGSVDLHLLRTGLGIARQIGFVHLLDRARASLAQICSAALANNIENDFVARLIKLKQLNPPPLAGAYWPWPVHVRTLGGFRLDVQGERYRPAHKAQDKPLELLKLLVTCQAFGRSSAEKMWIAERLWPDAESDNARKSLDMTVGRLRRLLGRDDTLLTNEGRLELSPTLVWTDIRLLLRALSDVRERRDEHVAGKLIPMNEASAIMRTVLDHYGGPYLQDEEGAPWLLAGREAVATAVRQALIAGDTILDGRADHLLIPALEKAFMGDPTSEDLARSLMRAHLRHGRNAEALRIYRRLREMLSLVLGVVPSADLDHIRDQAYEAEPSNITSNSTAGLQS